MPDERPMGMSGSLYLVVLRRDDSLTNEFLGELLQDPLLLLDLLVHQRLGEHGLVHLVVAVASVTHLNATRQKLVRDPPRR